MQMVMRSGGIVAEAKPWSVLGQYRPSLVDSLFPSINIFQRVAISLFFVGILVAFGRVTFYLPDNPVPISFQTTGVLLMGGVLGWRWGGIAILVYYLLGIAGIPVFKDGGNGWHYVSATATAGYLIGFVFAATICGWMAERGWDRNPLSTALAMLTGNCLIYIPGLLWLGALLGFDKPILEWGFIPFILGDITKLVLAAAVLPLFWKFVGRTRT